MKHLLLLISFVLWMVSTCSFAQTLVPPQLIPQPANDDEYFFNFRLTYFAPNTEPLIAQTFGNDPRIEEDGFWVYHSYTSCAVSFSTNLPTITGIEYGKTQDYGQFTTQSDSYYYRHLHYLKGLEPNTLYHYRIKIQDYDGNGRISADGTFTTKTLTSDVIRIPDDFGGAPPPYILTTGNAKYVLTQDLVSPTLGISIKTDNVEIDLDGHTIIYDNGTPAVVSTSWTDYAYDYDETASFGVRVGMWNHANIQLLNGTIKQGANGGKGLGGCGFNPVFFFHMLNSYNEIAGLTIDYYGDNITGIFSDDGYVHHNVIIDRGTAIDDRHGGIKAITAGGKAETEIAYNSLRRFRHQGIMGNGNVHHNELYSDSFDTNSFMIGSGENAAVKHNKLFGMGYMPIGIGWGNQMTVSNNFIYLHGTAPAQRSDEYARLSGIAGMRLTLYDETPFADILYEENTISLKAWAGCNIARGLWTATDYQCRGVIYRRNVVKVEAISNEIDFDQYEATIACVDINGTSHEPGTPLPPLMLFEDNTFIGNVNLITLGSSYGVGGSTRFYRTKLEKINTIDDHFTPVRLGYTPYDPDVWNTRDNYMIDTQPGNGIDLEQPPRFYSSKGSMEVYYGLTKKLLVTCHGNALFDREITIATVGRSPIVTKTDPDGYVTFELLTVHHQKNYSEYTRTDYSSYTLTVAGYDREIATNVLKDMNSINYDLPDCNVGIKPVEAENEIGIYPNPAKDCLYINGLSGGEIIEVWDTFGRRLLRHKATDTIESLPVNEWNPGIYLIKITGNGGTKTLKAAVH